MKDTRNRRVFVTGGGHGIGRAIVEAFALEGDCVAFCDIDIDRGNEVAAASGARFIALDVCDKEALEEAVAALLEEWGDLDVIVNNVGISSFEPIIQTSVEHFEKVLDTNLRSTFITSRLLAIHREKNCSANPYGRIINLCSTRYLQSEPGCEAYAASKGGIWSLTHALAVSLAPYHITVNCIAPGWISVNEDEVLRAEDHEFHLSGRVGRVEDIARTCLFLCEKGSDFINGQCITVDGGVTRKMIYPEQEIKKGGDIRVCTKRPLHGIGVSVENIGKMTGLLHGMGVLVENMGKMTGLLHGISVQVENFGKQHHESVVLPY